LNFIYRHDFTAADEPEGCREDDFFERPEEQEPETEPYAGPDWD